MFVDSEDDFMVDNLQRNTAFYVRILSVCYKEDTSNPRHELVNRANTPVDLTSIGVASGGSNVFLVGFVRLDVGCSFRVESGTSMGKLFRVSLFMSVCVCSNDCATKAIFQAVFEWFFPSVARRFATWDRGFCCLPRWDAFL